MRRSPIVQALAAGFLTLGWLVSGLAAAAQPSVEPRGIVIEPPPVFSKSFAPALIGVGGVCTLTFVIDNTASALAATALDFTDNLPAGTEVANPANASTTCTGGTLTAVSGSGVVTYTGGTVAAGAVCTVQVDVTGTAQGTHSNTADDLTSSAGTSGMATDNLNVGLQPSFAKVFAPDVILLGVTTTLTFTIDHTGGAFDATGLDFTDNLPAGTEIAATPNASTTCTGGTLTAVAAGSVVSYTGGTVAAGTSCTVQLDVTGTATGMHANTTGDLTSSLGSSGTADDTLTVNLEPVFTKSFAPSQVGVGEISTLTFMIDNTGSALAATALDFTDNLPAGTEVAATPNASTTCTGGSITAVAGSGVVSYTGGTAATGASCTLQVDVTAPAQGVYLNTTGDLTSSAGNSGTAMDTLTVGDQPSFSKVFAPDVILVGGTSTLTFTIDTTAGTLDATGLDFTDNLPAGTEVAAVPNAGTTCTGGTVTAVAASGVVSYSGGTVTAGTSCTVQVDVTGTATGMHLNTTGDLTSSLGSSGTASDTLTVEPLPVLTKSFAPQEITAGGTSVLTLTIDNTASALPASGLAFTDNLPAGMLVADPANSSNSCGGSLSAVPATGTVGLTGGTVGAGATCEIQVTVQVDGEGTYVNVTGGLSSNLGVSGPAEGTLVVVAEIPTLDRIGLLVLATLLMLVAVKTARRT